MLLNRPHRGSGRWNLTEGEISNVVIIATDPSSNISVEIAGDKV